MRGTNTLTLNEETVVEALQEYFDKRTVDAHRFTVTSCKAAKKTELKYGDRSRPEFVVETTDETPENDESRAGGPALKA